MYHYHYYHPVRNHENAPAKKIRVYPRGVVNVTSEKENMWPHEFWYEFDYA